MLAYKINSSKNGLYAKAYAYEIHATKSWNRKEVAYEDIFDSYTMDLNTFEYRYERTSV